MRVYSNRGRDMERHRKGERKGMRQGRRGDEGKTDRVKHRV